MLYCTHKSTSTILDFFLPHYHGFENFDKVVE